MTVLIFQKSIGLIANAQSEATVVYQNDAAGSIWLEIFHIFLNVVVPVLIFLSIYYFLFKTLGIFKELSTSIKKIADSK